MADEELTHADIIRRLDRLETKLEPVLETWQDVAALGRSGRIVGRLILWVGGLVVAVMATWNFVAGKWA